MNDRPRQYYGDRDDELWMNRQLPLAVMKGNLDKTYQNISTYELFNDVIIWGFVNYPDLVVSLWKKPKYAVKRSFDEDNFDPLTKSKDLCYSN